MPLWRKLQEMRGEICTNAEMLMQKYTRELSSKLVQMLSRVKKKEKLAHYRFHSWRCQPVSNNRRLFERQSARSCHPRNTIWVINKWIRGKGISFFLIHGCGDSDGTHHIALAPNCLSCKMSPYLTPMTRVFSISCCTELLGLNFASVW
jgi:hypothetical protein